jgi:hypothetical protein
MGQLGHSASFGGTNALIGSMMTNLVNWAGFKAPFTTVAYGPGMPPEGTAEPNPISPYVN